MFAVVAVFAAGRSQLLGFANSTDEVDKIVKQIVEKYGMDSIQERGIRFNAELAV